jgi:hypothetical protein
MDVLGVYNGALTQAGGRRLLASIADVSAEAAICRLWYNSSRDYVFRKAYWPSLRHTEALALTATNDFADAWTSADPPLPWKYAYALPTGMLSARYINSADTDSVGTPNVINGDFTIEIMGGARIIATNVENAILTYTKAVDDPALWDNELLQAVIHMFAANITMPLSGQPEIRNNNYQIAQTYITMALENQANADHQRLTEPASEIVESRGGFIPSTLGARGNAGS